MVETLAPEGFEWYAYIHVNGKLFLRRYLGDMGDIEEACSSPFVMACTEFPFYAADYDEALEKAEELLS